jgi:leucine efflux protein
VFFGIIDLTAFVIGTIVIVLLPGPNSLYVMTVASSRGVAQGYRGACGIFVGDTVLMVLSTTGVASLLHSTPALFMALKYAGAAYLAWLGWGLLRAGIQTWRQGVSLSEAGPVPDPGDPFRKALIISLMNPKAILFFISFFIQFVSPDYPHPVLSFVILGVIVQVCSALYLSALIFGGARLARYFRERRRLSATGLAGVGAMFIGFGFKLASASLHAG